MEKLTLLEVNKPEKIKETLNELINYRNTAGELPEITAEKLGLGNVDNTHDLDKPLSTAQKTYIDNENLKYVKLKSSFIQKIDGDIAIGEDKTLYIERGDETFQEALSIANLHGYETFNVGSLNVPLKLQHSKVDINGTIVSENPKIDITDETGTVTQEKLAFIRDVDNKISKNVLANAETTNGVVTSVAGEYLTDTSVDEMGIRISVRNISTGELISETLIPLKLASLLSRGLMSKEDVAALNDLVAKVAAMEGKTSRYIYTDTKSPTANEIDTFVQSLGHTSPYSGIAVVVDKTYHIWHYYDNDNIGWKDDGSDTVSQATNTSLGIVLGSNQDGKVYVESDGTMSLIGYDSILSDIKSLQDTSTTRNEVESMINEAIGQSITTALGGDY